MKTLFQSFALLIITLTISLASTTYANCDQRWQQMDGYVFKKYRNLKGNCDQELKDQLRRVSSKNYTALSYSEAKQVLFKYVDNIDGQVCSVYTPSQCKWQNGRKRNSGSGFSLNTEHTWPQSKGAKVAPPRSDLHHLYPASQESNTKRANFKFCEVYDTIWSKEGSSMGYNHSHNRCFEPTDSHKGNVARAIFYFATRYNMNVSQSEEEVLRRWHRQDPVDEHEEYRNLVIEYYQNNTNPFIDQPDFVDLIDNF